MSGPDGIVSGLRLVAFDYDLDSSSISFAEWVDAMIKDASNKAERDDRIKGLKLEIGHLQSLLVKWKEKLDEEG